MFFENNVFENYWRIKLEFYFLLKVIVIWFNYLVRISFGLVNFSFKFISVIFSFNIVIIRLFMFNDLFLSEVYDK